MAPRDMLSGPSIGLLSELFSEALSRNAMQSVILRAGFSLEDAGAALAASNKTGVLVNLWRRAQKQYEPEEAIGLILEAIRIVIAEQSVAQKWPDLFQRVVGALQRDGIDLPGPHPVAALGIVARGLAEELGFERARDLMNKALRRFDADLEGAVTASTAFAEAACRGVLERLGIGGGERAQLPELLVIIRRETNLEELFHGDQGKAVIRALSGLAEGAYRLAHEIGDRHPGTAVAAPQVQWLQVGATATIGNAILGTLRAGTLGRRGRPV